MTFSDPMALYDAAGRRVFPGHAGIMYQGDNWTYCGVATARPVMLTATGRRLTPPQLMQKIRAQESGHEGAERTLIELGAPAIRAGETPAAWLNWALAVIQPGIIRHTGCHRYVRPHQRDVAIVHRGRRVRHDPAAYPKLNPNLLDLLNGSGLHAPRDAVRPARGATMATAPRRVTQTHGMGKDSGLLHR